MKAPQAYIPGPSDLASVIATHQLDERTSRAPNVELETQAHIKLTHALAESPADFFSILVRTVRDLSRGDSAGISLLHDDGDRFMWPAIVGPLSPYTGGGTPRDFGPCGTVLERKETLLFIRPERYFAYLTPIAPPLEEVLIIPFHSGGHAVGTIWSVIHESGRKFEAEDRRLLEGLSTFATCAHSVLPQIMAFEAL